MEIDEPGSASGQPAPGFSSSASAALPRGLVVLLGAAAMVIAVAGMRAASSILGPVLLALVLTTAVTPLIGWARRRGLPSWIGVTLALAAVYSMVLLFAVLCAVAVARLATLLPTYADDASELVSSLRGRLEELGVGQPEAAAATAGLDWGRLVGAAADVLGAFAGLLGDLLFLLTLLFFVVAAAAAGPARMAAVRAERPEVVEALIRFFRGTRRYLLVSAVFGGIVAVLDAGALWLLGVPLPLLWGLLSFATNFIPNVGFILGVVPPALLGLLEGGVGLMIAVLVAYSVLNVVIQTFIQPRYVGDAVGLSAAVTFLSLVFWTWVLGVLGALLAVPLTLLVKAFLVDIDPGARWLTLLIGSAPVTVPAGPGPDRSGSQ